MARTVRDTNLETRAARLRLTARRKHYVLEEELFARRRDVLSTLDLVFMDTTSLYFEGAGGQTLGRRGFSKDHRPDLNQMILAVLLDGDGQPVCTEMWPGNTADVTSLIPAVERLRKRFSIPRVCVVAGVNDPQQKFATAGRDARLGYYQAEGTTSSSSASPTLRRACNPWRSERLPSRRSRPASTFRSSRKIPRSR
jgi:hypothetical protein